MKMTGSLRTVDRDLILFREGVVVWEGFSEEVTFELKPKDVSRNHQEERWVMSGLGRRKSKYRSPEVGRMFSHRGKSSWMTVHIALSISYSVYFCRSFWSNS